jgi:hypothetical protein
MGAPETADAKARLRRTGQPSTDAAPGVSETQQERATIARLAGAGWQGEGWGRVGGRGRLVDGPKGARKLAARDLPDWFWQVTEGCPRFIAAEGAVRYDLGERVQENGSFVGYMLRQSACWVAGEFFEENEALMTADAETIREKWLNFNLRWEAERDMWEHEWRKHRRPLSRR